MTIPMRLRKRDARTGRFPASLESSPGIHPGARPPKRHVKKSGGLERRSVANTKRRMPQARKIRGGRKGAIESRSRGGAYGSAGRANPDAR